MFLLQCNIFLVESINTINHALNKLNFRVSQAMLVGDIICAASLATRFSTSTTRLYLEFLTSFLESINTIGSPARQINMDRGPHTSTQVGGAGVNIAIFGIKTEVISRLSLNRITNSLDTTGQAFKYTFNITSHFHGDNSELIFLIDPDQEGLSSVMEDTTTLRPITFHASNLEVGITRNPM